MEAPELGDQVNLTLAEVTRTGSAVDGRERIKMEFYKTYDVMTGIRIAATLGGFFSMMILLVLYKNYCKPSKTLSEEQLNAAVTAAVEEEDRALKAALEATSFYTSLSKQRQSIAETAAAVPPRFSSVGGGYSHLAPPVRFSYLQQRGKSLPGSALRFALEEGQPRRKPEEEGRREEDEDDGEDGGDAEEEKDSGSDGHPPGLCHSNCGHLSVPVDRRPSSITCSSTDTSYLERRGSAFEMGLPAPPAFPRSATDREKLREEGPWDFYYPIDIQVIQPTPEISPAVSAETLCEKAASPCGLQVPAFDDRAPRPPPDSSEAAGAPLASISSLASPSGSGTTVQASENAGSNEESVGSDSVFVDDELGTEDEVDEFSTDSEFEDGGFDDDYSFCESGRRPAGRCQRRSLQFASFDSDTVSEEKKTEEKPILRKQFSIDGGKRRPSEAHSEPRGQKRGKQPSGWPDRGRIGRAPTRQMSVPVTRRKPSLRDGPAVRDRETRTEGEATPPSSASEDASGARKEMPSSRSLPRHEEKRRLLQKQRTVREEEEAAAARPSLRPPRTATLDEGARGRRHLLAEETGGR